MGDAELADGSAGLLLRKSIGAGGVQILQVIALWVVLKFTEMD